MVGRTSFGMTLTLTRKPTAVHLCWKKWQKGISLESLPICWTIFCVPLGVGVGFPRFST